MSCNTCAKSFSLLRKERGCPNCGFSYCSKCLDHKVFVPKLNAEAKVCVKCKKTMNTNDTPQVQAPDAYYKRLALLDNVNTESNSGTVDYEIEERLKKLKENKIENSVSTEQQIADRLNKIKGEMPTASIAELQSRLARLKGIPDINTQTKPILLAPDLRTEQEQADDLLKQYMEQTSIDAKYKDEFDELVNNMESRIQKLKGTNPTNIQSSKSPEKNESEDEDEDETIEKILKKVKKEKTLEENEIPPSTNDELPFCEICNDDAIMRCLGCRYLFCKRCFIEHKDDDDGCNRYEPYEPPKGTQ